MRGGAGGEEKRERGGRGQRGVGCEGIGGGVQVGVLVVCVYVRVEMQTAPPPSHDVFVSILQTCFDDLLTRLTRLHTAAAAAAQCSSVVV